MISDKKALIGERYRVLQSVDEGGTSYIFLVWDTKLEKRFAMKLLKPELLADRTYARAFKKEINILKKLRHKNIVRLVNYGFQGSFSYYIMDYVEGKTLKQYIEENTLTLAQKLDIAQKICDAMEYAHGMGVVHKDLKPANIVVNEQMEPVILDFGIAEAAENAEACPDEILGTAEYFSPEQAKGEKTDKYTDIYSMGILLYELMSGKLPFTGEDKVAVALKQVHQLPESPCLYCSDLPKSIERIILKAIRKQKADRYRSFAELKRDLHKALQCPDGAYVKDYLEKEKKERNVRGRYGIKQLSILIVGAVLAIVIIAAVLNLLLSVNKIEEIYMPSLQNKTLEEVQCIAQEYRWDLQCTYEVSAQVEEGKVIAQSPQMGVMIEEGERVDIVISLGAQDLLAMPNLIGLSEEAAAERLSRMGFTEIIKKDAYQANLTSDEVIAQYPEGGMHIRADETVILTINRSTSMLVEQMPQLVGQDMFYAVKQAVDAGFEKVLINMIEMDGVPGQVVAQYPTSEMSEVSLDYIELTVQQPSQVYRLQVSIEQNAVTYHNNSYIGVTAVFFVDGVEYEFVLDECTCKNEAEFSEYFSTQRNYRLGIDKRFEGQDYTIYIYLDGEVVYTKQYIS